MNAVVRRVQLYTGGAAVLSALAYLGFVRTTDPEFMTALGAADVQLRLAYGMPAVDKAGRPLSARAELLEGAERQLAAAARQQPDSPMLVEMQGFLRRLRGDLRGAAAEYRRARSLPGCAPEQRDTLVFNETRMLAEAGDRQAALAVFAAEAGGLQERYREPAALEQASLLHQLGRDQEAGLQLDRITAASQAPLTWLEAGRQYCALGRSEAAEQALAKAQPTVPVADYWRARLKLASGDVDSCLGLLDRALKARPAEVRQLLHEDAAAWQALAADARFAQITAEVAAAPGR
jgi:tetratricopeptide (TPR) repeat protein